MKVIKNKFKNLLIIEGQFHSDKRGYLREIYLERLIKKKYFKNFNSTIVADFILSKTLDFKSKNKFIWDK